MPPSTLAIVMPALNEERAIGESVHAARGEADLVVVCDGGSRDATPETAGAAGAVVVRGPRGRGAQLRAGAEEALARGAELLVFLHADSTLPAGARAAIEAAVADGAPGGGFLVRFPDERPIRRLGAWLINRRTRLTRCPLGDQAQFVTREAYERLGGLRDWPILEDLDLARRLKRLGRVAVLAGPVTTSARRFEALGTAHTIAINWLIWGLFFLGTSPERLAKLYYRREAAKRPGAGRER